MKNIILLLITIFTLNSCEDNNNKPKTELEKLPTATQTGANTIGCLVNGKALLPRGYVLPKVCMYDQSNFVLYVGEDQDNQTHFVQITSYNESLQAGKTYQLKKHADNSKFGEFAILTDDGIGNKGYRTNDTITGEFTITYHDFDHAVLSGTFWFDAADIYGNKIEVREGRFDMHYTE